MLEEENGTVAFLAGKLVKHDVAVRQIDLHQLLAVLTNSGEKSDSLIFFSHTPADAATFVATGSALKYAVLTHILYLTRPNPPDKSPVALPGPACIPDT